MWEHLTEAALDVVRANPQYENHGVGDLLRWILDTGYVGLQPHQNTVHLLQVYGGNLMNSGARGPSTDVIVNLIGGGVAQYVNDDVLQEFTVNQLAAGCSDYAEQNGLQFVGSPDRNTVYMDELAQLGRANGMPADLQKRILPKILSSVTGFGCLLRTEYGGMATLFHEGFTQQVQADQYQNQYPQVRLHEIRPYPLVGVATGMNFLKDTQAPAFAEENAEGAQQAFQEIAGVNAGWLVKPDMHVLRLMLWITGRATQEGVTPQQLVHLAPATVSQIYAGQRPIWNPNQQYVLRHGQPRADHGLWDCIEDMYFIASHWGVAPLGIDRLLYLIGSGRYGNHDDQAQRYATITRINDWGEL